MLRSLNLLNFDDELATGYALIGYWASWCDACKRQNQLLEEMEKELSEEIKIFTVDVNDNRVISNKQGVKNIPTLILYSNSKPIERFQGLQPKEIILQSIYKRIQNQ